jgi:hypothetical protein
MSALAVIVNEPLFKKVCVINVCIDPDRFFPAGTFSVFDSLLEPPSVVLS